MYTDIGLTYIYSHDLPRYRSFFLFTGGKFSERTEKKVAVHTSARSPAV